MNPSLRARKVTRVAKRCRNPLLHRSRPFANLKPPLHPARRRPAQRKHRELQTKEQAPAAPVKAAALVAVRAVTVRAAGSQPSQS